MGTVIPCSKKPHHRITARRQRRRAAPGGAGARQPRVAPAQAAGAEVEAATGAPRAQPHALRQPPANSFDAQALVSRTPQAHLAARRSPWMEDPCRRRAAQARRGNPPSTCGQQLPRRPKPACSSAARAPQCTGPEATRRPSRRRRPAPAAAPTAAAVCARSAGTSPSNWNTCPAHFKVLRHVRPKLACVSCQRVFQAAGCQAGRSPAACPGRRLMAHVMVSKYCDHQPLYRQSGIYARQQRRARPLARWPAGSSKGDRADRPAGRGGAALRAGQRTRSTATTRR